MGVSTMGYYFNASRIVDGYSRDNDSVSAWNRPGDSASNNANKIQGMSSPGFSGSIGKAMGENYGFEDIDKSKLYISSGQFPTQDKYQEEWMRPTENFFL